MSPRVRLRSGTDVPSLDIADHDQSSGPAVLDRLFIGDHAGNAELFIHGSLRFDSRDKITDCINDRFVELPYCLRRDHVLPLAVFGNFPGSSGFRSLQQALGNK